MNRNIPEKLLLFDIDGVLLNNLGYRGAFAQSLEYYLGKAGVAEWHPGPYELGAFFESTGVTSEWDMIPIVLAVTYEKLMQRRCPPDSVQTREQLETYFRELGINHSIDLAPLLDYLTPELGKEKLAATHLFNLCKDEVSPVKNYFPHLYKRQAFESLLRDTRDHLGCQITRQFQNRVIGSKRFEEVYNMEAPFACESTLQELDQVNLSEPMHDQLLTKVSAGEIGACLMTARPSYPPKELVLDRAGYSPEGETAVKLLKMEWLPLIGYGRLRTIASQKGLVPDKILKPSPFQALASIHAAATGNEYESLVFAWDILFGQGSPDGLIGQVEVHVFEDSVVGLQSCMTAADILRQYEIEVNLHLWGISKHARKMEALREKGARIAPDINHALEQVLG